MSEQKITLEQITSIYVEDEIKDSYLDYSMSVIVSRALPDVRDGLKPVHRRILYAMDDMGMSHDKPHKKCARIVGEVLGKYHPHGDTAVYNALVRMAQDFNFRYELINGHGNFGSIDGDSAAAMRYTEARLSKISSELLKDIDKDTINYRKNFDDSLDEPIVLPARLPNLLLNGSTGIAVGMATSIPPHNLSELVDSILALIDNTEITIPELMKIIPGPDFPTKGLINGKNGIVSAYTTGRGRIKVRGKVDIKELKSGKPIIIIKEIPYQVNKSKLIEKIADLVKIKKITGITDLRDESDRNGIRIVIELKKGEEPELVLNKLYKYTDLQTTFSMIMLALVNNIPKILNLKEILTHYINHRFEVITRKVKYELTKAEKRSHILEGFRTALDNIDRIIDIVRKSKDANEAKELLINNFSFSEIQSKAILDMRIQRLTGLEREKIEEEYMHLLETIKDLKDILSNDSRIYTIMKEDLLEIKEKYGDSRRTIIEESAQEINIEDLIKDEKVIVTLTNKGYIKRMTLSSYKAQRRGGKGVSSQHTVDGDFVESMYTASNLDNFMIFTNLGKVYNIKVYEIPESSKQARGKLISNLINLDDSEKVRSIIKVRNFDDISEIFFLTRNGTVKKTKLTAYKNINRNGLIAIKLRNNDDIIYAGLITDGNSKIFIATKLGYSIKFQSDNLRSLGRSTTGVKGITLRSGDEVVSGAVIERENVSILSMTKNGYGKRTDINDYPVQSRAGKGVINIRVSEKNGNVVEVKSVSEDEEILAISSNGALIRTPVNMISAIGRITQGVRIMRLKSSDHLVSIVKVKKNIEEEIDKEINDEEVQSKIENESKLLF